MDFTRRQFLGTAAATGAAVAFANRAFPFFSLQPVTAVENPLGAYPSRDWEKVYRDQYR